MLGLVILGNNVGHFFNRLNKNNCYLKGGIVKKNKENNSILSFSTSTQKFQNLFNVTATKLCQGSISQRPKELYS